jgi:hypothetical protein
MTPTGRFRVGRSYSFPASAQTRALMHLPPSLAIALWLTGAMWFVGLLAYRFEQPPELVGGIFIMGIIAAVMEWLIIKPK